MRLSELKSNIKRAFARHDLMDMDVTQGIEQGIRRIERLSKHYRQEKLEGVVLDSRSSVQVPDDMILLLDVLLDGVALTRKNLPIFLEGYQEPFQQPVYTLFGTTLQVAPAAPGATILIRYHAKYPMPTSDTGTNALIEWASELVEAAALSYIAGRFEDARQPLYEERMMVLAGELKEEVMDQNMRSSSGMVLENPYGDF